MLKRSILAVTFTLACGAAHAASIEMLKSLLQQTSSGKARFAQIVVDKNLKELQKATGTMQFVRPGRFRWEYDKPYEQTIVGDGAKLWIYDKDLNQVTVRKLDKALGASPAALLAGSNEIEKIYNLTAAGSEGGLEWLREVAETTEEKLKPIPPGTRQ